MSKHIRLGVRAEVSSDGEFAPADFILKFAEELSGYENIVYIPETDTLTYPAALTIADISGWDSCDLLIIHVTGDVALNLNIETSTESTQISIPAQGTLILQDIDTGSNPSIQAVTASSFEALVCGK